MKLFSLPLICLIILPSLFAFQQHDQNIGYTHPTIVISGGVSYKSLQTVPAGTPITSASYWEPLLDSLPATDPGDPPDKEPNDSNITNEIPPDTNVSDTVQIFSLSTRAGIYGDDISASLKMGGDVSTPKKVMFRVKGPSMNFNGAKLTNPWMDVYKRSNAQGSTFTEFFKSYDFGDHASSSEYESRSTGNPVEPLVVDSITPSTVSCLVNSETAGGSGNAIVEIYSLKDDNSSSFFKNLSTRGYVSESDMTGSLSLKGTGTKHIMFRVKGPSMNFSGTKLADPNLAIYHKENNWAEIVKSSTFQQYEAQDTSYKNVTDDYTSRHTGNNLEPMVVYELGEGTYSCIVFSDISGGMGNAILEIYDVSE